MRFPESVRLDCWLWHDSFAGEVPIRRVVFAFPQHHTPPPSTIGPILRSDRRRRNTDNRHPLSLAIREAAEKTPPFQGHGLGAVEICFIAVGLFGVTMQVGTAEHWHVYRCDEMPDSAYEFIERFKTKHKQSVTSFSFTLMRGWLTAGQFRMSRL